MSATDLLEDLDLGLRLCRTVGVVSPAVDEGLQVLAVLHLGLVFLPEVAVALRFGGVELCEVTVRQLDENSVRGSHCTSAYPL